MRMLVIRSSEPELSYFSSKLFVNCFVEGDDTTKCTDRISLHCKPIRFD